MDVIVAKLLDLVPSAICNITLEEVISIYEYFPNLALVPSEAWRWRAKSQAQDTEIWPSTL